MPLLRCSELEKKHPRRKNSDDKTILRSLADFDNAQISGVNVMVLQNGKIIDYGGPIEKLSDNAGYINGGYFLKENCEFRVR
jgi:ABC-type cobalamin/Fe3+-siderophores transport system ATPase subunit